MTEEGAHRRQYDVELGQVKSEVAAAHARLDSIESSVRSIAEDLKGLRGEMVEAVKDTMRNQPSKLFLGAGISGILVVLTILTLVISPVVSRLEEHREDNQEVSTRLLEHAVDGHPMAVLALLERVEKELTRQITSVDRKHAEEHVEQEEDIRQLRDVDSTVERRFDRMMERLVAVEVQETERLALLNLKAGDRWPGRLQEVYAESVADRFEHMTERIGRNERLLERLVSQFLREDGALSQK